MNDSNLVEQYLEVKPKFEKLCEETKRVIVESFSESDVTFQNIDARAKTTESFIRKAKKLNSDESKKYNSPLEEITDLAGVRIITYTLSDLEKVDDFITKNFDVLEKRDVGEERYKEGKFGYQSIHYLVKFSGDRARLSENKKFLGLTCEIQIRTVLQHAWAEIEHDIQYKSRSDIPRSLQRKFIALAGLLEIADREFQAIQDEDYRLKQSINESFQDELTREAIKAESISEDETVRALVRAGKFTDAIDLYTQKLQESPKMYTLFLGRAKARFLAGDRSAALQDIEEAIDLNPDDPAAQRLREQVLEGATAERRPITTEANELNKRANSFLEMGDGISAFEFFSKAQEQGASRPFSLFNKAMACFLASDFAGSKYFLGLLHRKLGTPMSINVSAMLCLVSAASDPAQFGEEMIHLKEAMDASENFIFSMSPLAKLKRGMQNWQISRTGEIDKRISQVFAEIEG